MTIDIPVSIEPRIHQFADAQHISSDEAVVRILEAGLELMLPPTISPFDILGAFSSPAERAVADEALELAVNERVRRNNQTPDA